MGILKNAGLVQNRRLDYWVFYRLKDEAADFLENLLEMMDKDGVLKKDLDACRALESNRELSRHKVERRMYKPAAETTF